MRLPAHLAALLFTFAAPAAQQQEQPQTFRASAAMVIVDVSVRRAGAPVEGLSATDFVLLDNGVRQTVERVDAASVPLDLTLVADLSYKRAEGEAALRADLAALQGSLRPTDRIRVLLFDDHVRQVVPFTTGDQPVTFALAFTGHHASLTDALIVALSAPVEPGRRHVVIVKTRGIDTMSLTDVARLEAVARTSDAQLHVVFDEMTIWEEATARAFQCSRLDRCLPTHDFWQPSRSTSLSLAGERLNLSPYGERLNAAAVLTGGRVHRSETFRSPSLRSTFEDIYATLRQSYVLRYAPTGVSRDGWHTISVTVPSLNRPHVQSRRGYWIGSAVDDSAPTGPWLSPNTSDAFRRLVLAFDAGQHEIVSRQLAAERNPEKFVDMLNDAGNPWPTDPRREAILALAVADASLFSGSANARTAGLDLLTSRGRLIRHAYEADTFERYWHWAAVAIAQGTLRTAVTRPVTEAARARFPHEPRFVLGAAIAADQEWTFIDRRTEPREPRGPSFRETVEPLYRAAMAFPETGSEARVRLAWGLHQLGLHEEALTLLRAAEATETDVGVAFLRYLFEGRSLSALDRHDEAIRALREALRLVPTAQSARVALMTTLLSTGRSDDWAEAEALAGTALSQRELAADPWWSYWQGDYRFFSGLMRRLQESIS
ncbi:MAG: hypothetical protein AMXMBFR57_31750 [Acidimicrobiia bacterium]